MNLGARYSFFNIFHEVLGRANPFDFATCGPQGFCGVGASFGQPNYGDFDPRVALAWAPRRNGHTVIRAGFGTYHEDGQLDDQNLPIANGVSSYSLSNKTTSNLSYPIDPFLVDTTGIISPRAEDRRRKDTLVTQWSLSVQQALPLDFVGTVAYVGSEGAHLLTLSEVNVVDPETGIRPYPTFGQVSWRGNISNSNYQALSVSLKRTFSRGLLLSANYQWSHEIDDGSDGSGDGDSLVAQNVGCQSCERASGIWDVRHVFNVNAVYISASLRSRATILEPAGNLEQGLRFLGSNFHGSGAHRISCKRYDRSLVFRRTRRQQYRSASRSRTWRFADSPGRRHVHGMDQSSSICSGGKRDIRQRSTECGPWPVRVADGLGPGERSSGDRASTSSVSYGVL